MPKDNYKTFCTIQSFCLILLCVLVIFQTPRNVLAISSTRLNSLINNRPFYDKSSATTNCSTVNDSTGEAHETITASMGEFIDKYGQAAFDIGKKYGIPYEAIIAQAALESGYGKSQLTQRGYNFFGIKAGSDWNGKVISMRTREQRPDGSEYYVVADFRAYDNAADGFEGYGQFIHNNSRYSNALNFPNDPVKYIQEIKAAGYATANDYVSILTGLIHQVENYIKEKGLFPPSSEVTPDVAPPDTTGTPTSSSSECPADDDTEPGTAGGGSPSANKALGRKMVEEQGWEQSEFECLDKIWSQESGWDHTANNPTSSAYGIPQALIDTHRATIKENYSDFFSKENQKTPGDPRTYDYEGGNPATQIRWGLDYIKGRYGTPCKAWEFKSEKGWY